MKERNVQSVVALVLSSRRVWVISLFAVVCSLGGVSLQLQAAEPEPITRRPVEGGCPLNSGGPSLLNTQWRVESVYGNPIPRALDMTMTVRKNSLTGHSGCNTYTAYFRQVGNTGFRVTNVDKGKKGCSVLRPVAGGPTINVGDLEGGYLRTLRRMGSVQHINNKLVFYNRNGTVGVVMARK